MGHSETEEATAIMTTDTDFRKLCENVGLNYENPVPDDKKILRVK